MVHATEKQLVEHGGIQAVASIKGDVETAMSAVREAVKTDDLDTIKAATTALTQSMMKIGEAIYTAKGGAAGMDPGPGDGDGGKDDDIVDADFEEVKDDKKRA